MQYDLEELVREPDVLGPAHEDADAPERTRQRRRPLLALGRGIVLLALYLIVGNALILGTTLFARWQTQAPDGPRPTAIDNFRVVDDRVWRGAAPGEQGLKDLAALGVTTVVDLRAEYDPHTDRDLVQQLGLHKVHLPVRDGQLASAEQLATFDRLVAESPGVVFVHCGAGVGRTGAVVAHHLTKTGQATGSGALWHNLSVGPPSFEQILFAAGSEREGYNRPGLVATGMSRVLDAPRRIWHNLF